MVNRITMIFPVAVHQTIVPICFRQQHTISTSFLKMQKWKRMQYIQIIGLKILTVWKKMQMGIRT